MLKLEIDDKGLIQQLQMQGDPRLIAAQFGSAITHVYQSLCLADARSGQRFRLAIQSVTAEQSPCWGPCTWVRTGEAMYTPLVPPEEED